ncbi:glycosyltransferase family 1 protein [Puteibacter caeruleilacunae]|nr:glycosyltransferase family 1 protein [Puteibacter caeruleilacunae]
MMKIAFDAKRAFQNTTGLGNYSRNLLTALAHTYPDNEYLLFAPKITSQYDTFENQQVITPTRFYEKIIPSIWRTRTQIDQLKQLKPQIFHGLSHELPIGIEKSGIRTVVTVHDLIFMRYGELYGLVDRNIYARKYGRSCKVADKVIAISKQTKADLMEYFKIPEERIEVIYQTIDQRFFDTPSPVDVWNVKEKYNLPENFILNVGTIEERKNLLNLVKALQIAKCDLPLVVVGKPTPYMMEVQNFLNTASQLRVQFLHNVDFQELLCLYNAASFSAFPSIFEGFGLPVVESLATGTPVITSNVSSLPEAGGDAAVYADPWNPESIAEKIDKVAGDPGDLTTLKQHAQQFNADAFAQGVMDLYQRML